MGPLLQRAMTVKALLNIEWGGHGCCQWVSVSRKSSAQLLPLEWLEAQLPRTLRSQMYG